MKHLLFHISEDAHISRFMPRVSRFTEKPVVWAVAETHLENYLLPRDCPRVTYYGLPESTSVDVACFLGKSRKVVAVESCWLPEILQCRLYLYEMPVDTFDCIDQGAGYFVSYEPVTPLGVTAVSDPLLQITQRQVEIRILPELWTLRDAVLKSSLQYSFIRMRNAQPRS